MVSFDICFLARQTHLGGGAPRSWRGEGARPLTGSRVREPSGEDRGVQPLRIVREWRKPPRGRVNIPRLVDGAVAG
jgi:hypothetical protein